MSADIYSSGTAWSHAHWRVSLLYLLGAAIWFFIHSLFRSRSIDTFSVRCQGVPSLVPSDPPALSSMDGRPDRITTHNPYEPRKSYYVACAQMDVEEPQEWSCKIVSSGKQGPSPTKLKIWFFLSKRGDDQH